MKLLADLGLGGLGLVMEAANQSVREQAAAETRGGEVGGLTLAALGLGLLVFFFCSGLPDRQSRNFARISQKFRQNSPCLKTPFYAVFINKYFGRNPKCRFKKYFSRDFFRKTFFA